MSSKLLDVVNKYGIKTFVDPIMKHYFGQVAERKGVMYAYLHDTSHAFVLTESVPILINHQWGYQHTEPVMSVKFANAFLDVDTKYYYYLWVLGPSELEELIDAF